MWAKGSYTIEAVFVLMMTLSCILGVILLAFRMHDRMVIEAVCYEAAVEGQAAIVELAELEDGLIKWEQYGKRSVLWRLFEDFTAEEAQIHRAILTRLEGRLLCCKKPQITVSAGSGNITITYSASVILYSGILDKIGLKGVTAPVDGSLAVRGIESEELLRFYKGIFQ